MNHDTAESEFDHLDDVSAAAYRLAVLEGRFRPDTVATQLNLSPAGVKRTERVLRVLRLIRPVPGDPLRLVPVSPDAASSTLLGPMEQHLNELDQHISNLRSQLASLRPVYFEGRRLRNHVEAVDAISEPETVQSMIDYTIKRATREVLTVQPGGARPPHLLRAAKESGLSILGHGLALRTLYQHTARTDPGTQEVVREVSAAGGQFRTAGEVIDRVIIIDREVAFVPQREPGALGAVVVREPSLVAYHCSVFEYLWRQGVPFDAGPASDGPMVGEVKQAIVRLMAEGHKDEVVARRLGMSVRTCRRHISEITEELRADSRFQAGVKAVALGWLLPTDAGQGDGWM
ncbi:hypothetical protein AB0D10_40025 [Kitasatospora sp. NPDC048545]|uniref:helix-turn-helix transcriptional regulator n=1 Tax=Kitasatospora sp. NPDC048545 TaxID=3157208 RepID=UPI0033E02C46